MRRQGGGVDGDLVIKGCTVVGGQAAPVLQCLVPRFAGGGVAAALEVGEGDLVRGDQPGLGAGLDAHVTDGHAAFHGQCPDGLTAVLDDRPDATAGADATDDGQDDVLGGHAVGQGALNVHRHGAGSLLVQGLGGQHVLNFAGADAERQCAKGAVGGGVAVAAHDGHARHGESLLRPDHMDDALVGMTHGVLGHAVLGGVVTKHLHLLGRDGVGDGLVGVGRGDVVVLGGHGEVGPAQGTVGQPQAVEGLWGRHLVHQVQVDVEKVGAVAPGHHDVVVPDLLAQCSWRGCHRRLAGVSGGVGCLEFGYLKLDCLEFDYLTIWDNNPVMWNTL